MKHPQEVLGDGAVGTGLVRIANLGTKQFAFGWRDKGVAKRHHSERKGMSMMKGCKLNKL